MKTIEHTEADAIPKALVSKVNRGVPGTGIMGADMLETYKADDGRTLTFEYGNGYGRWQISEIPK